MIVVPSSTALRSTILMSWRSAIQRAIESPRPEPPVSFVRDMLKDDGYFDALTKEQDVTLRRLLNRLHDSTRSVANRGFTPNEIKEQQREARAKKEARKKASRQKVVFLKDRNKEKSH